MKSHDHPRCKCHNEPMDCTGDSEECAVKRRARRRAAYHANPATDDYARTRRALRARIELKRQRIAGLEERLAQDLRASWGSGVPPLGSSARVTPRVSLSLPAV